LLAVTSIDRRYSGQLIEVHLAVLMISACPLTLRGKFKSIGEDKGWNCQLSEYKTLALWY
jgi:hypothetical protein